MKLWISIYLTNPGPQQGHFPQALATALLQYTPDLAVFDSRSLVMDVGASLRLFNGPRNLCRRVGQTVQHSGYCARIGMAPTAMGAMLLACQGQTRRRRVLSMPALTRQLQHLHVVCLPAAQAHLDWLHTMGCTTLQSLTRLPRAGLRQRTSPELLAQLDAAYGKTTFTPDWYRAPDTFQALCHLDFHTSQTHALMAVASELLGQLCGWLQVRQHLAASMQFFLHHEKGRHACPPTCLTLGLSTPSRHVADFLLVLEQHLRALPLPAPVISIQLRNVQTQPEGDSTGHLFPDRLQQRQQENQLLDLLRARLGRHSIMQPQAQASHLPEYANYWVEAGSSRSRSSGSSGSSGSHNLGSLDDPNRSRANFNSPTNSQNPVRYPFWMLDTPVPLTTHNHRPVYQGHALQLLEGPHRIESGWWHDGQVKQRDYFVAIDPRHCRYWVYRERGTDNPHWFLHGLFA